MSEPFTSTRGGFLDFSPVKRDDVNKENDVPILSLIQFSKAPFLTFGTVKLGTSKSAVLRIENPTETAEAEITVEKIPASKGFSVDHKTFTIQPEGSFSLIVTWTPTEEGGVRELIIFNANGVLKHQAVMLGRAEAPKKKKKSLWDTIKNKREGEKMAAPRRKKPDQPLKMAANMTFHVSRKPQYRHKKPRSPLSSINEAKAGRESSLSRTRSPDRYPLKPGEQKRRSLASSNQENIHRGQRNDPLIPARKLTDSGNMSASPDSLTCRPENRDLSKVLNRTLSPIGTPERFKKLMPHVYSDSPLSVAVKSADHADGVSAGTPVLSLKDALALIDSDLSPVSSSPRDAGSSCGFSDSLESKCGNYGDGLQEDVLRASPDGLRGSESSETRLTFVVVPESDTATERVKKASFTSVTVTKSKAPAEPNGPSGRKIKKSRRRLLENTLELSEGSGQSEFGPDTPRRPVIGAGMTGRRSGEAGGSLRDDGHQTWDLAPQPDGSPSTTTPPPSVAPSQSSSPPLSVGPASLAPLGSSSPLHLRLNPEADELRPVASTPAFVQDDSFPVHLAVNDKKRKSEEYLRSDGKVEDAGRTDRGKRSRVAAEKPDRERSSWSRRPQRAAGSTSSSTSATQSRPRPPPRGVRRAKPTVASSVKAAKGAAVAQSKLTFIKPAQTAIPRHPMPFAAKNMFYDERWMEKQERGFTWWINHVLTPDDFKVNTEVAKVNAVSIVTGNGDTLGVPRAPTREEMSFSTYTARRKLNRLRRAACQLFTSEAMAKAIQRLELEVEARRLLVRKDRHLWKDIGERTKVLNWLLSYNPLWLRIGLETVYGELISLESNDDAVGLAVFILQRLLWNPDIAGEFCHAKVPRLYRDGHEEALSRFTLKKLLLLVCFLDKAKESRLIEHNPCLFCLDAEFKTSKDLLLAFSRDFLSGEGILPRHLGYLGLPVSHVQTALDEFNFAVKNLAVDLKCGIRLVRVMELLVQDWSLSAKLRLPAISRLQKVHNVNVALQLLKSKGLDLTDELGSTIDSRDIVDGHREKTLSLLWKIIFAFQVEVVLDEDQLREEIGFLQTTLRTKWRLASLKAGRGFRDSPAESRAPYEHGGRKMALLMDWVRAVCDFYGLKVENFTVAFSDGRVLCHLVHHYHPSLVPWDAISHRTTQTVECSSTGRLELSCSASDSDDSGMNGPCSPSLEFKELLENERNNLRLVNTAAAFLGGVPAMINPADMSNTIPSEKVVMSYLSFLCARLLDLRNETRAARLIQGAWRRYRLRKGLQLYEERNAAAVKIQLVVRTFLQRRRNERQNRAAIIIQSVWRGYASRHRLRLKREAQRLSLRHEAATVIQAQWRRLSATRAYRRLKHHVIVVQAQWRMRRAASAYGRICWAVMVLQRYSRSLALAREDQERYLSLRNAAVKLQRRYRMWKTRKVEKENRAARVMQAAFRRWYEGKMADRAAAAVRIQRWYRMQRCLHEYRRLQRIAVIIQARYRGHAQRRRFQTLRLQHRSAVVIQSALRGHAARKQAARIRRATVVIQRWFRASVERALQRQRFVRIRHAAVTIQAAYRGKVARESLKAQHEAAKAIQVAVRKHAARRRYLLWREAAVVIQRRYRDTVRARRAKEEYDALRNATLILQASWRGRAERRRLEERQRCATLIQSHYRRHKAQAEFWSRKAAAQVIQRRYRAYAAAQDARAAYLHTRAACVTIQAVFRGTRVRADLRRKRSAAIVIQASVRMFLCKKKYILLQSAAIIVQSRYRALLVCRAHRNEFGRLKRAAVTIQAVYRGFRAREDLQRRHCAARAIQARFRMHRTRVAYLASRCAAIIIQRRFRAQMLRDGVRRRYGAMKSAAVVLQAAFRGHRARRTIKEMHQAATVIQRRFLTVLDRRRFLAIKAAALVFQRRYRALTLARTARLDYLSKRSAAIRLQSFYRGYGARKLLRVWRMAAVTIQSAFRRHREVMKFQAMRLSAIIIQRRYRACIVQRRERKKFLQTKRSTVVLQAAFRGHQARRHVAQMHRAATVIQANFRRQKQQLAFRRRCWAACVLQQRFRALKQRNVEFERYQEVRKAVISLQAAFRGMRARRNLRRRHQAASVLQRAYRTRRQRKRFLRLRASVFTLQQKYRANVAAKAQRTRYLHMLRAAVVLQATYRGQRVRRQVAGCHQAATVIQSAFRRHREEVKFQAMRLSAIIIQRRYRACIVQRRERKKFLQTKRSTVVLQAAFRGHQARRHVAQMHRAATVIQANFRRQKQQLAFRRRCWAACVLQQRFRALKQRNVEFERYQEVRKAVISLQAAFRGMRARRNLRQRHQAAAVLQRAYRTRRQRKRFLRLRASVFTLQQKYRANVAAKAQRTRYLHMLRAAVVLQATYRGQRVRRQVAGCHQAATVIQSAFRRHREEVKFQAMRLSAIIIQRRYRACIVQRRERKKFLQTKRSTVVLQAAFRGHQARRHVAQMHRAATVIQANFRRQKQQLAFRRRCWAACVLQQRFRALKQRNVEFERYQEVRKAVISLQAAFRGMRARRNLRQRHQAAAVLQRAYRTRRQRKRFLTLRSSVLAVQRMYRAVAAAREQMKRYQEIRSSAIVIQAAYRGHRVREVVKFQAMRLSAIVIQRRYRAYIVQRRERKKFLQTKRSTVVLQGALRGWLVRRDVRRQSQAAVVLQAFWRCSVQRRTFRRKREAAVKLQRRVRAAQLGRLERSSYARMREAAITLQTHCRAWIARIRVLEAAQAERRLRFASAVFHHISAMRIQRALRSHWALESARRQIHCVISIQRWVRARQQQRRYLEGRRKVITAQRAVRRWLSRRHEAASVIQSAVRRFILLRRQRRVQGGIIKAQALWRGHRSRQLNDNPSLVKLRRHLLRVSAAVREEDKLCNKTASALDHLLRYKHFSYILEALKNLETATRLSPECCERLVESGATSTIFTLIRCCNRSVPCMDVITFSIQILLNLSKYHRTTEAVYSVDSSVETLLDLLQRYREKAGDKVADKGGGIFTKACFLLALLLQDKQRAAEVTKLPKVLDRIRSVYRLTARKHKMDAERTFVKQRMNASVNGSFFVPTTPRKFPLAPKFAPDWVLSRDKLQDVADPLRAIQMVANTLCIAP